ncbi:membrane-spanning 4-domains subfamily A member 12-like [Sinocyclocheilus rhinocerous]|uniref:Membrane-spanning 4-domains subfamily A member 12-like n=1 Tax=Sinocyclocheilus rhinocerous TaxID=307959 RepID=A0A673I9K6_9TELE|nr:PREDICTED: membrane-spanning 4-domains subfamily A member 12-like [Sinocyclocheilus rhinocerous]
MTLTVSTDLSVNTSPTQVEEKLQDKQKALRDSIEKGEPKIFGVAQIVIGLLIISYSIPLLSAERTMILNFGVPWWSGLMFVISGAAAIALEKYANLKAVSVCLAISALAIIISVIALVLYYADIAFNPATECHEGPHQMCGHQYYATHFSTGLKTTISMVSMVQTAMSSAFTIMQYNQRRNFTGYATMTELHPA